MTTEPRSPIARRRFIQGGVAGLALGAMGAAGVASAPYAAAANARPLVLHGGKIFTFDGSDRVVDSVAISGGRIIAAGSVSEVRRAVKGPAESINLRGACAFPGVNDSHLHGLNFGLTRPPFTLDVGYPTVNSIADIRDAVAARVTESEPGQWIRGRGWDPAYLGDGRQPHRDDLDAVSPNNPVILTEWSGHAVWVNTAALEAAGVTDTTVPPAGGVIVKDADGQPTGVLLEGAAYLVRDHVPDFTAEEKRQALTQAFDIMHAEGITSYTEPGLKLADMKVYDELLSAGTLSERVSLMLRAPAGPAGFEETLTQYAARDIYAPEWLNSQQVKIFADGVPTVNKTAWLSEPYVGGGYGSMTMDGSTPEEQVASLEAVINLAHEYGFQIGTHATGDRTIDAAVAAYAQALQASGESDRRHYIIHCDLPSAQTLSTMAQLQIGASFNPNIKWSLVDSQLQSIGRERAEYEWPYASALRAGVNVSSTSDAPVVYPDFRRGISMMMERRGRSSGDIYGPEEEISFEQALRSYCQTPAWQDRAESWKGRLQPGFAGDITVVDGDISRMSPTEIADVPVRATIINGEVVYDTVNKPLGREKPASWQRNPHPKAVCGSH
ncbi:amidohydrolase [Zhihengliuella flava]|uniref:Amidohydrolase YtcJ n=1 Tax=Zhihengliuella flava TaxID=1285193 RepID=A0A931GEG0_9MICC|nr:amidohydrolase [Zhihengliuella flava]MBG6084065.1 putative amidohydrolase YtcJ [Zhihengliuella flava]